LFFMVPGNFSALPVRSNYAFGVEGVYSSHLGVGSGRGSCCAMAREPLVCVALNRVG
jgi:hypothetical protein